MSDDFVRDLEDELVAAAAFRATRRARRFALPRAPRTHLLTALRGLVAGAAVLAVLAAVAVLALTRGGDQRTVDEPPAPPPTATFPLSGMLRAPTCEDEPPNTERAADALPPMAVFRRAQLEPDGMPVDGSQLPVSGFDQRESRRPGRGRLDVELTLVPSGGVRRDGRCPGAERGDDGPGLCIVAGMAQPPMVRCFPAADIAAGRAVAQLGPALLVGVVPDGVAEVTLAVRDKRVTVPVVENAYEAVLPGGQPGDPITVAFGRDGHDGCRREVAPELLSRVTALHEPAQPGYPLPRAALDVLNEWMWQLDAIVEDGARYWGGGDGVAFWVVPVVPRGSEACAPATRACVVAVPERASADAHCVLGRKHDGADWRLGPLIDDRAVIYGVVPDGVDEAQVTIGSRTARVEAGLNVIGGVLPFPYRDGDRPRVELISPGQGSPEPRVAVVDAGGDARAILDRLARAGYETTGKVTPGVTPQEPTVVYWWPDRATREATARVAALVAAEERQEVVDEEQTPRPVLEAGAPVVVVVGTG